LSSHAHSPHGFEEAETPEEITRRQWMANATIAISGVIGLTLALKHQRVALDAKKQQQHSVGPIPATR